MSRRRAPRYVVVWEPGDWGVGNGWQMVYPRTLRETMAWLRWWRSAAPPKPPGYLALDVEAP